MRDYSQFGEQAHILAYFQKQPGRCLDIGAYDGETFSNTRALIEQGWEATLLEPDPCCFLRMLKNCESFSSVRMVNAALALSPGLTEFFHSGGDALSTTNLEHRQLWVDVGVKFTPIYVSTITIDQLLVTCPGPYPFVNLDVEGTNWELLQSLPIKQMQTRLVCVEYQDKLELVQNWLTSRGLTKEVHLNGTNVIMGAE